MLTHAFGSKFKNQHYAIKKSSTNRLGTREKLVNFFSDNHHLSIVYCSFLFWNSTTFNLIIKT